MPANKPREEEILLDIYRQRYQQIQHFQQMRATYFNIYVAVIGFSVATIFSTDKLKSPLAIPILAALIWVISIFSIMRAERWGGHISHDLNAIRKIQNHLSERYEAIEALFPVNPRPLTSIEFNRPPWSRNRSIETLLFMAGAMISAIAVAYDLPGNPEIRVLTGILLFVFPILIWRAEVSNQLKRHANCCLSSHNKKSLRNR
jgi:hypothetical protein